MHIVGEGSLISEINKMISCLGIEENVVLYGFIDGFIDRGKLDSLYLSADVVVVPSRSETFGITVLQAMAAGKPLVVSNRGALPELVKHLYNGLVSQLNPKALADSIINMYKDKNLRINISRNNKRTIKSYTWDKIFQRYIHIYEHIGTLTSERKLSKI